MTILHVWGTLLMISQSNCCMRIITNTDDLFYFLVVSRCSLRRQEPEVIIPKMAVTMEEGMWEEDPSIHLINKVRLCNVFLLVINGCLIYGVQSSSYLGPRKKEWFFSQKRTLDHKKMIKIKISRQKRIFFFFFFSSFFYIIQRLLSEHKLQLCAQFWYKIIQFKTLKKSSSRNGPCMVRTSGNLQKIVF